MELSTMIIPSDCAISFDTFVAYLLITDELIYFSLHMIRNKKWAALGVMILGSLVLESILLLLSIEKDGYLRLVLVIGWSKREHRNCRMKKCEWISSLEDI